MLLGKILSQGKSLPMPHIPNLACHSSYIKVLDSQEVGLRTYQKKIKWIFKYLSFFPTFAYISHMRVFVWTTIDKQEEPEVGGIWPEVVRYTGPGAYNYI